MVGEYCQPDVDAHAAFSLLRAKLPAVFCQLARCHAELAQAVVQLWHGSRFVPERLRCARACCVGRKGESQLHIFFSC
jgi:hypothetical protein